MAAIELTIKAMSMGDLENTVHDLSARFHTTSPLALGGGDQVEELAAPAPEAAPARRPGRPRRVAAAASPPAAEEAQAAPVAAEPEVVEDLGNAAGGAGGAVESEAAAEDHGEDRPAAAAEEPVDVRPVSEAGAGGDAGGPVGAATGEASPGVAGQAEAVAEGAAESGAAAEEATLEDLKSLAKEVAAKKSFETMKKVFEDHGVAKPGATPDDKIAPVMAALRAALGQV